MADTPQAKASRAKSARKHGEWMGKRIDKIRSSKIEEKLKIKKDQFEQEIRLIKAGNL